MPQIYQLPLLSQISGGDQLAAYAPQSGDARRLSINSLLTYFQQNFASPTVATTLYTPTTGFNIAIPTPVSSQWALLQPAGTLASGTITLPLNTSTPDGTEVLVTSTQTITALTISLNGASALYGVTSGGTLTAATPFRIRFYQATNSWYRIV
jgi:hypothetical protein